MSILQAFVLGLIQGLTEFAPVSSSAHLRMVSAVLGWGDPGLAFSAVLHLGAVLAAVLYFRREVWALTLTACKLPVQRHLLASPNGRLLLALGIGIVPVVCVGWLFHDFFSDQVRSLHIIGAMLILVGIALWFAERFGRQTNPLTQLRWGRAFLVGVFQLLALLPGASRSGSVMLGGLCMGLQRDAAARFSFLMGIPVLLGAGLLEVPKVLGGLQATHTSLLPLGVALLASSVASFISIAFSFSILRRMGVTPFVLYRIILGGSIIIFASLGIIH